ncbi:hypothetical protein [Prosthecomicrobium pneumaticum]|uniref:Uncharacterized protein n=1 Tax=Prosthecomicrobium pneumaticum TaxID=81895 RepID=A0A7W9CUE8_9HYPH|nr:hypothetical protein [Prosthecomicrobium pneumaticum]MBB5751716.1 hypothetical protein [Prosthecomicrobium pneumaticum]
MIPAILRRAVLVLAAVVALLLGADFLVAHHPYFGIDGLPGFALAFGGLAALATLALGAAAGRLIARGAFDDD